jgi:hypothetical protein
MLTILIEDVVLQVRNDRSFGEDFVTSLGVTVSDCFIHTKLFWQKL